MTDDSTKNQEGESGAMPQGHPLNVGTEPVMRGSEATNVETRIVTGETKK